MSGEIDLEQAPETSPRLDPPETDWKHGAQ
jgi:hypothetical protein